MEADLHSPDSDHLLVETQKGKVVILSNLIDLLLGDSLNNFY